MLTYPKHVLSGLLLFFCLSISQLYGQTCTSSSPDTDSDGICDARDQCPNMDDAMIGSPCDDGKSCTTNDRWTTECDCEGTPISDPDNDGICGTEDQCSNFDDDLDIDDDGIPYCQDDCIDVNENGICDDVDTAPFTNKLKVYFSLKRGFYDNGIQVSLIANKPNTSIRYELGSNPDCPTASSGSVYSGPISINASELLTLKVIGTNNGESTKLYTHTYIFSGHEKPTVVFSCSPYDVAPGKDETPISFEFIVPSSNPLKSIQEYASTKPSAGGVQAGTSDKIYFRSAYGAGTLKEDLFSDFYYGRKPVNQFDQLFLRGDHSYGTRLNQIIAHDALRATEQLSPAGRNVYFYEFGTLEDIRHLQERPESGFMEAWTGFDKPNWEAYSGDQQSGLISRINNGDWEETKRLVNIESFGNFLLNQWVANCWDFWDNRNYRTAGPTNLDAADGKDLRWHYFNWDWDLAFPSQRTSWRHSAFQSPEDILGDIRENEEFDLRFADIIQCAMYDNGPLTAEPYNERVLARHNELQDLLYPGNPFDVVYDITDVTEYIPVRVDWLKAELTDNNYYPDLRAVRYSQNEGTLAPGQQLTLSNPSGNGSIYYTLDGSDVRSEAGVLNPDAIPYTSPITLPPGVHDVFARVYNPSAPDLIDRWSATCGSRVYYVDQDYSNIIINEIHYSPVGQTQGTEVISGKNFEFIELRNNGSTPVDLKGSRFSKGVELDIEESLIIPPGGYLVFAENATAFESRYGFAPDAQYSGKLSNEGEKINLKDPFGYFIDTVRYNNKNIWDEGVDSTGFSLELLHESLDNDNPLNWFRSDNIGGTPRTHNSRTCPQAGAGIVINEINYNSSDDFNPGDWVELHNPTASTIDLSGWSLYDTGDEFVIPDGTTLAPEGFVVIVAKEADFKAAFPNINDSKIIGELPFGLSSKGERITLFDSNKCLADYVIFNDKAPWPEAPDGDGPSLSLLEPGLDNALAESWESSMIMNASFVHGSPSVSNVCVPGQSCDDGDECTSDDTFDNDCNCAGTLETADSDGDGVCDIADICDGFDDKLIGTPCDDGNECSVGETYDTDCECSGGIIGDVDNDGLCDALDDCDNNLTGTSCEDGDPCTVGETYDINCNCTGGVLADSDNDGICNELDRCPGFNDNLLGQVCDDGNPDTEFDMYNTDACGCTGIIVDAEVCSRINNAADDAEENRSSGSVSLISSDLEMVEDGIADLNIVGMRFTNMQIPQGATITDAKIQFTTDETDSGATTVTIVGENSDNPSTFTTTNRNITSRPTTSASETWTIAPWSTVGEAGSTQQTVDISAIIQEIIDRPNFQSGNAIVIMVNAGSGARVAESFNGSQATAPELCVSYNTGTCQVGYPCNDFDTSTDNDVLQEDCSCKGTITEPDNDGDGVPESEDCNDNDPSVPAPVGSSCDDNNPNTENDVIVDNGCICAGELIDTTTDIDGDGVPATEDCNDYNPNIPTAPGTTCDDEDASTFDDVIGADGCTCTGERVTTIDDKDGDGVPATEDCNDNNPLISIQGDLCNDNNPNTINDRIQGDCSCVGSFDVACPELGANIGDSCNDENPNTSNDQVNADCECIGTVDFDCSELSANIGDNCNDNNPNTSNDQVTADCECIGTVDFDCSELSANIGDNCNDNNPNTSNDQVTADCECIGTVDFDCSELSANIGDNCNDDNPNTSNDQVTADCECIGTVDFDCSELSANIGDNCNDNNPNTSNDQVNADCECIGTVDFDCSELSANIGDNCNDNNPNTSNDQVTADCECIGTVDFDCSELSANIGDNCNDDNPNTSNDQVNADCECIGTVDFDCSELSANIGDNCNDDNPNTSNDQVNADCECIGTATVINPLKITGINYNPLVDTLLEGSDYEFLLVTNYGDADISVAGDSINGYGFVFPEGAMIADGETVMLVKTDGIYPDIDLRRLHGATGSLKNGGEQLTYINSDNATVNDLEYDDKDPWPTAADGEGSYLRLRSPELDNTLPENWDAVALPALFGNCADNGGDADGDGVCANIDCDDTNANISFPGNACDDNNPNTENDVMLEGCICQGITISTEVPLNITGINYNPTVDPRLDGDNFEFILVTNYGEAPIAVAGDSILGIDFAFPEGTMIMAGETVMLTRSAEFYPELDFRRIIWEGGKLSNGGEQLVFKTADNSIINDLTYDDKDPWAEAADGNGSYLQLIETNFDNTVAANWIAVELPAELDDICEALGGDEDEDGICGNEDCNDSNPDIAGPGSPCNDNNDSTENDVLGADCMCIGSTIATVPLNITGINYNPTVDPRLDGDNFEFILVTNYGDAPIAVAGDSILGIDFAFPEGTMIMAGETVMLTRSAEFYPELDFRRIIWEGGKLSNGGEQLVFKAADNSIINDLTYDDKDPWAEAADGNGSYLQLIETNFDNTVAANWIAVELPAELDDICEALGGDEDEDGICGNEDCNDSNPDIAGPGSPCNDNNDSTENDVLGADCMCIGSPIATVPLNITGINYNPTVDPRLDGDNFEFILVTNYGDAPIAVAGDSILGIDFGFPEGTMIMAEETVMLTRSAGNYPSLDFRRIIWEGGKLSNGGEQLVFKAADNSIINDLTYDDKDPWAEAADGNGSYLQLIEADFDNTVATNWIAVELPAELDDICEALGGDEDEDGICGNEDCNDSNPLISTTGDACDDQDSDTDNDAIDADCNCVGTMIDKDNDGVPPSIDCDDNDPTIPTIPGTACNDQNSDTENDIIGSDGCSCAGTMIDRDGDGLPPSLDCDDNDPALPAITGTACDDENSDTENDVIGTDGCSCAGTMIDRDGDGVPPSLDCDDNDAALPAIPGTACNDQNSDTENDIIGSDGCSCTGTMIDEDNDGLPPSLDCDDNDAAVPAIPGTACNDENPNTENDVIGTDGCSCAGTPIDTGDCVFSEVDFNNFDNGLGIWNDPGTDCDIKESPDGSLSIRIRDNHATSFTETNVLDFVGITETEIDFAYTGESMEDNEDFFLEYSTDGGATYIIAQTWVSGIDFQNDEKIQETVNIVADFTATTTFRFRCDATTNYDKVYLDDIRISTCTGTSNPGFGCPELMANINDPCDDGDADTDNDTVSTDCRCVGTPIVMIDCPELNGNIGEACDDNNPNTINDVITSDCGCAGTPIDIGDCRMNLFSATDFESGFGIWIDGGGDAAIINGGADGGASGLRLRDNSGLSSSIYTSELNFSGEQEIELQFLLKFESMEDFEDLNLEYSLDGGTTFITAQQWISGVNFNNGDEYLPQSVTIMEDFTANTIIRLRCDATTNYDRALIDNIEIFTCSNTPAQFAPVNRVVAKSSFHLDADKKDNTVELSVSHSLLKEALYLNIEKFDHSTGTFEALQDIIIDKKSNAYTTTDNELTKGDNVYRATVFYADGTEENTELQIVSFSDNGLYNIFPNPTSDILNVDLVEYLGKDVQIILYNINGNVLSVDKYNNLEDPEVSFDISSFTPGQYLITVDTNGQKGKTLKFSVIQ